MSPAALARRGYARCDMVRCGMKEEWEEGKKEGRRKEGRKEEDEWEPEQNKRPLAEVQKKGHPHEKSDGRTMAAQSPSDNQLTAVWQRLSGEDLEPGSY